MPKVPLATATEKTKAKLVNRGPAGLLTKAPAKEGESKTPLIPAAQGPIDRFSKDLQALAIPIEFLSFDPENARLHPERNMQAIKDSLSQYGQVKPIVVRRETNTVIAGNGTLEAAKALGWTKIAASFVDFSDAEAAGFGLADNRSAELAKWDFEVVARIDKLLQEAQHPSIGWTQDELEVLRAADWTPPAIESTSFGGNGDGEGQEQESLVIGFSPDQYEKVGSAIELVRAKAGIDIEQADALTAICDEWLSNQEGPNYAEATE